MLAIIYLTECISQPDKSRKIHNSFRETGVRVGETFNLNEKTQRFNFKTWNYITNCKTSTVLAMETRQHLKFPFCFHFRQNLALNYRSFYFGFLGARIQTCSTVLWLNYFS